MGTYSPLPSTKALLVPQLLSPFARLIRCHWPLLALALGCDLTGQYEKKFQESLQSSGQRAVFDVNLHPTFSEVADAGRQNIGVKLRLPKIFDGESKSVTGIPGQKLQMPGVYSIVRELDDNNGKVQLVFVTFVVLSNKDQKAEAFQANFAKGAAKTESGASWADVSFTTPNGQTISLKRMKAETQTGKVDVDGRAEFYYIEAPNHHVIIGWAVPKPQAEKHQLDQAVEAAMGTLEITGAPAADPGSQPAPANAAPTS